MGALCISLTLMLIEVNVWLNEILFEGFCLFILIHVLCYLSLLFIGEVVVRLTGNEIKLSKKYQRYGV